MKLPNSYLAMILIMLGLTAWSMHAALVLTDEGSVVDIALPDDVSQLEVAADAGDLKAQTRLAEVLYEGRPGVERNQVEAYKWAVVATSQGHQDAKHVLAEFDLFMSAEERAKGKALAETYLAEKKQGTGGAKDREDPGSAKKVAEPEARPPLEN